MLEIVTKRRNIEIWHVDSMSQHEKGRSSGRDRTGHTTAALHAIVLDFDGVIIESNDAKTEAFEGVFGRFPELREEMMAYHHEHFSASRFVKFDRLLHRLGRTGDAAFRTDLAADFHGAPSRAW